MVFLLCISFFLYITLFCSKLKKKINLGEENLKKEKRNEFICLVFVKLVRSISSSNQTKKFLTSKEKIWFHCAACTSLFISVCRVLLLNNVGQYVVRLLEF